MNWYYVNAGTQAGPVDDSQLEGLVRTGQIQPDTLVWHEGMAEWQPLSAVAPAGLVAAAPPVVGAASAAAPALAPNEVVCAECHRVFPTDETIQFGNARVCAACKPIFMQKLAEGAKIGGAALQYATVLTRFAAVFLDGLLMWAINFAVRIAIGSTAGWTMSQSLGTEPVANLALTLIIMIINVSIAATYEIFMIGKYGATLGKMACKVRVVTPEGGKVSYARAAGRYFAKFLSAFTCLIGYIIAFFDSERRALHDRICNTRVISVG